MILRHCVAKPLMQHQLLLTATYLPIRDLGTGRIIREGQLSSATYVAERSEGYT